MLRKNSKEESMKPVLPSVFAVHDDFIIWGKGDTDAAASADNDRNLRQLSHRCQEKDI